MEEDKIKQREHWQAIARQLGLDADSESADTSEPAPPPPRAIEVVRQQHVVAMPEPVRQSVMPPRADKEIESIHFTESVEAPKPEKPARADIEPARPEAPRPAKAPADESEPSRHRETGGRRQGRREPRPVEAAAMAADPVVAAPAADGKNEENVPAAGEHPEGKGKRRRRKRTRRKKGAEEVLPNETADERKPVETEEIEIEVVAEERDEESEEKDSDDGEELDTLSDWDIPSWTELISSLHRPDR